MADESDQQPPNPAEDGIKRLKAAASLTHKAIALVAAKGLQLESARTRGKTMSGREASITVSVAAREFRDAEAQLERAIASEVQANRTLIQLDLTERLRLVTIDTVTERQEGGNAEGEPKQPNES